MKIINVRPKIVQRAETEALAAGRVEVAKARRAAAGRTPLKDFQPAPDPLEDVADTGSVQGNARAELAAVQTAFYQRRDRDSSRSQASGDAEYWFAAVFELREQKDAFLRGIGLFEIADKYVDGRQLAYHMNIELPEGRIDWDARQGNRTKRNKGGE